MTDTHPVRINGLLYKQNDATVSCNQLKLDKDLKLNNTMYKVTQQLNISQHYISQRRVYEAYMCDKQRAKTDLYAGDAVTTR